MLTNEAKWIGNALSELPLRIASPCLNLGSSTANFRAVLQPHIERYVIAPAKARGMQFIHADIKEAPGVDIVGDIYDPDFQAQLSALAPGSILCCNMLEHVLDRQRLADICTMIVRPGGYIIVSVPRSFPYHRDPIDTYFRPAPADIAELFSGCETVTSDIISDKTYWEQLSVLGTRQRLIALSKIGVHSLIPFYKWDRWKERLHPLLWLFRSYRVSVIVLKRLDHSYEAAIAPVRNARS